MAQQQSPNVTDMVPVKAPPSRDPIVDALQNDVPGVATVTPTVV